MITNSMNLPQSFVAMASVDYSYADNEYRVTSLLKGTRELILERRHKDEITRDVSDMIWLLFGTAAHTVLESTPTGENELREERLKIDIGEYTLSGKPDLYDDASGIVTDYKTCSVWKVIYGDYSDWRRQLLMYAYMLREKGFDVRGGCIVAIMKDHVKSKAKYDSSYPQLPVKTIEFPFTDEDFDECREWLSARFAEIRRCEALCDDALPVCTPEERYNKGDKYAVMKKGRKTAMRVFDSMAAAEEWKDKNGGDFIDIRPGENKKCLEYCSVCDFCNFYRGLKGDGNTSAESE